MKEHKKEIYKGYEISYSVYGEGNKYSATGSVRLKDKGLTLSIEFPESLVQSNPENANRIFLDLAKRGIDAYI